MSTNKVYIAMGRVLAAHENRQYFRKLESQASQELKEIPESYKWDYPEGGGSGWPSSSLVGLEAADRVCSSHRVKMEKYFKLLKLNFAEQYPAYAAELIERLDKQSKEHHLRNKQQADKADAEHGIKSSVARM